MNNLNQQPAATGLAMVVLPQQAWESLTNEVREMKHELQKRNDEEMKAQWIESSEARKILGVSLKTWQTYRDERKIPFSQFGRKIYVKKGDLDAFMEAHYITAKA